MSTEECSAARSILGRAAAALATVVVGAQNPLSHLALLRSVREQLDRADALLVDAARREGASWGQIALARGTTRQAERQGSLRRLEAADVAEFDRWLRVRTTPDRTTSKTRRSGTAPASHPLREGSSLSSR